MDTETTLLFLKIFMVVAFAFISSILLVFNSIHCRITLIKSDLKQLEATVDEKTKIDYIERELGKKAGITQSYGDKENG